MTPCGYKNFSEKSTTSILLNFICYGNEATSSSASDIDRYVIIRNLLNSAFDILPVFIPWWEIETYEGESVHRSQMDIKRKTCDFRTWKKDIYFSTYPPQTLIHLFHRFTSASKTTAWKSFWLPSQPLSPLVGHHLRLSNVLERISRPSCELLYVYDTHFPT
jgi:hypothetical protein